MKKMIVFGVLVMLSVSAAVPWVYGNARRHSILDVNQRYTYIEVPPDVMLCAEDSTGGLHCLTLPPGTVLMLPVPDEAPVDTLKDRS